MGVDASESPWGRVPWGRACEGACGNCFQTTCLVPELSFEGREEASNHTQRSTGARSGSGCGERSCERRGATGFPEGVFRSSGRSGTWDASRHCALCGPQPPGPHLCPWEARRSTTPVLPAGVPAPPGTVAVSGGGAGSFRGRGQGCCQLLRHTGRSTCRQCPAERPGRFIHPIS